MSAIPHIPDFDTNVEPIDIDPSNVWDNTIHIDNYLKDRILHEGIIDINGVEGGPSSSSMTESTPTY